ncbi:MAG: Maf-like protein [Muribaculaceae bacterium]|nr:Maf-like protein [Muribaculaceae bacterium]
MLKNLKDYNILLASKSPRRQELMSELHIPFKVITLGGIDESYPSSLPAMEVAPYLSKIKANAYLSRLSENDLIITADTVVILNNKIYGKPDGRESAISMLEELSGKAHHVVTGVSISTHNKQITFSSVTEVVFAELSKKDIEYYVDTFLPFDKAGAYGIQEWIGCIAVERINGSFYNVMGLPVHKLYKELQNF